MDPFNVTLRQGVQDSIANYSYVEIKMRLKLEDTVNLYLTCHAKYENGVPFLEVVR